MKNANREHLVIVRTSGSILNLKTYNCQELGLAKALHAKGLRVSLILAGNDTKQEEIDGIDVQYCSFKSINQQLAWFSDIESILAKLEPSVIQVHDLGILMTWRVVRWAKKHNIPSFLIQGTYETTRKPVFKQLEQLFNISFGKYILKNVTGIGYKTLMASRYVQHYHKRETKPTYIGLDDSRFFNAADRNWRKELNIIDKNVLLYVGVLEPRRNPLFLLQIIENLSDDYVLLMVGNGPSLEKVKDYIESRNLSDKVILLGKQPQQQLPSLYKSADVFLLASNYEIYGMVILESMYFGLPVISSMTAGSETLIQNGKDGIVISNFDVKEWNEKIEYIFDNPQLLSSMSTTASFKIKDNLIWEKAADNFLKLYFDHTEDENIISK